MGVGQRRAKGCVIQPDVVRLNASQRRARFEHNNIRIEIDIPSPGCLYSARQRSLPAILEGAPDAYGR